MKRVRNAPIDPDDLKPLFYWAGLTLHACQQLEHGTKVLLVTMAEFGFGGFRLDDAIAIIEDEQKKTLGQILEHLQQRVKISEGWSTSLKEGLRSRNRFIHGFLTDSIERVVDPATRDEVIADVKAIRRVVLDGDHAVRQMLETLFAYGGLDWKRLNEQWADEVRAMNRPANDEWDGSQEPGPG
ncbi:MAG: hypothetical protein HYY01_10310 [Chloroflexi bacterium]|nr:hypothetical protein [Chloroflexota bacterium]